MPVTQPIIPSWQLTSKSNSSATDAPQTADAVSDITNGSKTEGSDSDGESKTVSC